MTGAAVEWVVGGGREGGLRPSEVRSGRDAFAPALSALSSHGGRGGGSPRPWRLKQEPVGFRAA